MNPLAALANLTAPDESQLTTRAQAALRMVESMVIDSEETYQLGADELQAIKAKLTRVEQQRTSITGPINQALRAINDLFRAPTGYLSDAEAIIKRKMLGYKQEQERAAAEARRKAEEAAAAERRRLDAEAAERTRVAEAQARWLQEEAAAAVAAGNAKAAEEAQQAAATVQQNAAAEVAAIQQVAQVITAPVVVAPPPKAAGISTIRSVDFQVTDLHALVRHIAERPELLTLVAADSVKLRAYVKGLGMNCNLPGVRVFEKETMAARAKVAA